MDIKSALHVRFEIPDEVTFEKQEGFVIVNDGRFGTIFGLDPNASFFWEALSNGLTPGQTVEQVLSHCPATREEVERDLGPLLERWLELDLVRPLDSPEP